MNRYLGLLWIVILVGSASAQREATLALHDGNEVIGVIVSVTRDSVYLAQPQLLHYADQTEVVPMRSFSRNQVRIVSIGGKPSLLTYALFGFLGGAVSALATGLVLTAGDEQKSFSEATDAMALGFVSALGAIAGTGIGLLYGLSSSDDRTVYDMAVDADYELLRNVYVSKTSVTR